MQLDWVVNYEENKLTLSIDNHRDETIDGGQNIYKYTDDVLVKRIRQFPDKPDTWLQPFMEQPLVAELDEWPAELEWLLETYPDIVGEKHFVKTYKERDGSITEEDFVRGMGVNNLDDLQSVNRIGQPASVQERWDWDIIASVAYEDIPNSMHEIDPNVNRAQMGLCWGRNKNTKEIRRYGMSQNCPCHVFPQIYVPVTIAEEELNDDVLRYNGTFIK